MFDIVSIILWVSIVRIASYICLVCLVLEEEN